MFIPVSQGSADLVESTYASKGAIHGSFGLGDLVWVREHGRSGLFKLSLNAAGGALIVGDVLKFVGHGGLNYRHTSVVYSSVGKSGKTELKGDQGNAAAAVSKNGLSGLPLGITVGTGIKQFGMITGNDAATTSEKIQLYLSRPFGTSLATTDDLQILPLDIVNKTDAKLNLVAGVAPVAVADGYYFWRQVSGLCFVNITDSTAVTDGEDYRHINASATAGEAAFGGADEEFDTITSPFGVCVTKIGAGNTPGVCLIHCLGAFA